ncbi:acyltransferase [Clavibacter michiganensis]|uniref:acyltransferase n=1 Tax=Clavibacter michiganensis TaxID=28447 RepID=UPI00292F38B5|nr:acyltransferase [Clavibacter michiganensis]
MSGGDGTTITAARADWVDAARAMAILLVALFHAGLLLMQEDLASPVWATINSAFVTFRMPIFFLASGLLAGSAVRRSWPELWNSRIAILVWALAIWSVLRFLYFSVVPLDSRPHEGDPRALLLAFVFPATGLWFLHALAVFLVVAKIAYGRVPPWIQLGVAAVLSALFLSVLRIGSLSWDGMAKYLVFFLIGLHAKDLVFRVASRPRPIAAAAALVALGAAGVAVELTGISGVPGVLLVVSCLAMAVGVLWAALLARTRLVRPLRFLGRNTLPIYVAHVLVIAAACAVLDAVGFEASGAVPYLLPLVVSVVAIAASLALHAVAMRTPLRFLYRTPPFLVLDRGGRG